MATYTTQEAIDLLDSSFNDLLDSGGEEEIEEDPSFPLPRVDSDSEDEEGPTEGPTTVGSTGKLPPQSK